MNRVASVGCPMMVAGVVMLCGGFPHPRIQWNSRRFMPTLFHGRKCIAVAADSAAKIKNTTPGPLAITETMTSPMP